MNNMKCDHCENKAEYTIKDDYDIHLCKECAVSYFGLYPMQHYKCEQCGKPCVEGAYEEDGEHYFCSAECAIKFCIELYCE